MKLSKLVTAQHRRILAVAVFLMATGNATMFQQLWQAYPPAHGLPFIISLTVFFTLATALWLTLIGFGRLTTWILAFYLLASSQAAYFMDKYGTVIDSGMIENIFQTDAHELSDLLSFSLVWRTVVFAVVPIYLLFRFKPKLQDFKTEVISKLFVSLMLVVLMVVAVAPFTSHYASFIRVHKMIRFYSNPLYYTYSLISYLKRQPAPFATTQLIDTAPDAVAVGSDHKPELIVLVVGETARADRFSLNGYPRKTNPELEKQQVVSFTNVTSCGTSTAVSVPCMFSVLSRADFNEKKASHLKNVLDVLQDKGVQVLWRDNNSDSKGVALRVPYEDFKTPQTNPVCDEECRDIGMLSGLDTYIKSHAGKDILLILHQMGNHGPAYFKRYPKTFERFTPVCKSNELSTCTTEEINNAYDNAILYTDYFLSNVIQLLQRHDDEFETAMLYVSDHGESLGELGMYLHGAPYAFAPKGQTHVPAVVWMGKNFDYKLDDLRPYRDRPFSHDDLYCLLLVTFEINSKTCESKRPILLRNEDIGLK